MIVIRHSSLLFPSFPVCFTLAVAARLGFRRMISKDLRPSSGPVNLSPAAINHLESILTNEPVCVDSKALTESLSLLDATLTKYGGRGGTLCL